LVGWCDRTSASGTAWLSTTSVNRLAIARGSRWEQECVFRTVSAPSELARSIRPERRTVHVGDDVLIAGGVTH